MELAKKLVPSDQNSEIAEFHCVLGCWDFLRGPLRWVKPKLTKDFLAASQPV